jgi:hypothetical protein
MLHFNSPQSNKGKSFNLKGLLSLSSKIPATASTQTAKEKVVAAPPAVALVRNITLPPVKALVKKYKKFERHNQLYEQGVEAARYIGRLLTSREFSDRSSSYYDKMSLAPQMSKALTTKDPNFYYMSIKDKTIETRVTLEDLNVTVRLGGDQQMLMDGETIIKSIFPSYKTPVEWKRITSEDATVSKNTNATSVGEDIEVVIPLESLVKIAPRHTSQHSDPKKIVADKFALEKSFFDSNFSKIVGLKLTLKQTNASIGGASYGATSGSLANSTTNVYIPVNAELILNWPLDFALYVTCCEKSSDFIPFIFYQYITWHRIAYGGGKGRGGGYAARPPSRINNMSNILRRNEKEKARGRNPKIRVNEDGFTILGVGEPSKTGEIYWIPDNVNKVQEYVEQIKKAYNATESRMELYNVKLKGEGLYTDPYNDKFTHFRETGTTGSGAADISGIQTTDLTGATPLDRVTIYNRLQEDLRPGYDDGGKPNIGADRLDWFLSLIRKFVTGEYKEAKPSKNYGSLEFLNSVGVPKNYNIRGTAIDFIKDQIARNMEPVTWANLGGAPLENIINNEVVSESNKEDADKFVLLRAACQIVKEVAQDMLTQFDKIEVGFAHKLDMLRFYLLMITKYAGYLDTDPLHPQKMGIRKQAMLAVAVNSTGPVSDQDFDKISTTVLAPNLPGVKALMAHQLETAHYTRNSPAASLTEVSPGGGKTIITIREVCDMLYSKKIKRPLVICPGNLVRNWINEISYFSQGKINGFALTIQSLRRLQYVYTKNPDPGQKPDYAMLIKIINSLPANTILVTSYNFLSADKETVVYGNQTVTRLYSAEFLRDVPCDLVAIDESHYAKNLNSNRTLGVSVVQSAAKYKRGLSGTTVNDSLDDLIGQAGVMVPAALGSESRFNTRYMTPSGAIKSNAPELITADVKPYIQRVVHKKQKWASQLPRLSEQFHPVRMTQKQAEFYDQLLRSALDEIKAKNPKLHAKLLDGGSESTRDNNAIQQGLGFHLQAVEQFLYAPDSNDAFLQLEDLEPEDLVSPKIAQLERILTNHFRGYTDAAGYKIPADTNKVIIFSHRTKTSEHIMKHLSPQFAKMAVRYTAGDFKALQSFLKDDRIKIIVADEISINTGQNFQLASRMIRLETLWSPGDQEQALARIWRPDLKSGIKRDRVFLDWIFTDESLEVCKIGRLISKIVVKMKYDQQDNPAFTKEIFKPSPDFIKIRGNDIPQISRPLSVNDMLDGTELELVKMSSENMRRFNRRSQLSSYFAIYALANTWEDAEFEKLRKSKRYSKTIDLPKDAYVEIENSASLPYYPRLPGVEPQTYDQKTDTWYVDPNNPMGYKPISVVENESAGAEEDEDEDGGEEVNPVSLKDIVDTEFGIGRVTKLLDKEIWVDIRGLGEVKVPKSTAWLITNEEALERVENELIKAGKRGIVRLPAPVAAVLKTTVSAPAVVPKPRVEEEDEDEDDDIDVVQKTTIRKYDEYDIDVEDDDEELEVFASIIDGQIALSAVAEDSDSRMLLEEYDFQTIEPHIAIKIKTVDGYDRVMKILKANYEIAAKFVNNLDYYRKFIQAKSLNAVTTSQLKETLQFFKVDQNVPLREGYLRPYPIIWGDSFLIAFNAKKAGDVSKITRLIKAAAIPNVHISREEDLVIKFYKDSGDAIDELTSISRALSIPNKAKTIDKLRSFKKRAPEPKKLFNLRRDEDEDESEEEEIKPVKKSPFFKPKPKTPPSEVVSPKVQKKIQTEKKVEPPAKTSVKKPLFKFNLGGKGKIK